ncbi:MAG: AAA family ATPase [Bacteroidota bacterium]|nr:AAA family ATPase [Bacteroidota bacterium]
MYISKLNIKNYRNFKEFEIDLKPFTLIIGENNIGKTNLLNAIGLIFSQDITFFKKRMLEIDDINYETYQAFKKSASKWNGYDKLEFPEVKVEVILTGFENNEDQEAIVSDWFIDDTFKEAKLTYHFGYRGDWKVWATENEEKEIDDINLPIEKFEYSIYGGLDQTKQVDWYFLRMLKMEFLDALRDAQKELIANNESKLLFKILNNRDKSKFDKIKESLKQLDIKVDDNDELKIVKIEISEMLKKMSLEQTEDQNKIGFRFSSLEHTEILKKLAIEYGVNPISIDRNGLGRNNVLFMSLILSHLTSDAIKKQNVFFRVVGIEEPEAHLHPHLQEHLATNISTEVNEGMQIILTSHSTHITSKLDLENTVVLYHHEKTNEVKSHFILDGLENVKEKDDKETKEHKHYLSRYLDASKSSLLFGRKMILVEGISEQILIPRFFELYTKKLSKIKTLQKIGCTLVNVNSVAFSHFLELVQNSRTKNENFFIKCLVLTDQDTEQRDKKGELVERAKKLKLKYDKPSNILIEFSSDTTFEKDVIEANKSDKAKDIMFDALSKTKSENGKKLKASTLNDIEIQVFFEEIEEYKADFATDLYEVLKEEERYKDFNIPKYITNGFDFILGIEKNETSDEQESTTEA